MGQLSMHIIERLSILWNGNILINFYNYVVLRNVLDNIY